MSDYSMELHVVEDISQSIQAVANHLNQVGETLSQQVKQHTNEFEGDTKNAFVTVEAQYEQAHETMTNDLALAQRDLEDIRNHILEAERVGSSKWGV
jgi:uncharacterized protein YukE